jgi:hypothetical protein
MHNVIIPLLFFFIASTFSKAIAFTRNECTEKISFVIQYSVSSEHLSPHICRALLLVDLETHT